VAIKPNSFLKIITIVSLLLAVVLPSTSFAHKYYSAMTRVNHNVEVSSLEVIHRFFAHDIEEALELKVGENLRFDNLSNIEPHLKAYVEAHFSMALGGVEASPDWIGYEVEENSLWVYQEQMIGTLPSTFQFENTLLLGVFPDQINTVTLTIGDLITSLTFMASEIEGELKLK